MEGFADYEVKISKRMKEVGIPTLVDYIKQNAIGYDSRVYQEELQGVIMQCMPEITEKSVAIVTRACIKYIRYKSLVVGFVSNQDGNWVATDPQEMFTYEKKVYQSYIGHYNLFKAIVEARREKYPDFVPYDEDGNIIEWTED